ncbi:alpha/beta fold hydrolase [Haloarchaeobius amylolyticus]|uniref:alpha/beta fold hydrolase n=1 Tax=Haloarchaeobius amylolyticus TaxID=1198296 RepID=UPI002270E796|nr:alpha/beta hydrolase [Haloarchaeobius amylolyticus]
MQTITHHGRRTAYEVSDRGGDGAPVLFVHGSGGTRRLWKSQSRLSDDRPVVTLDLSGHGESDDIDADPGYESLSAYADDVLAVAEETDASVVVGNSLGGAVVMHLLLERDHDFDGAVLAGTGAKLAVLDDLREWLADDFERAIEFLHDEDRLFHDPDPRLEELSIQGMRACGRAVTERDFLTCHEFDVRDEVARIDVPTLCLVGEYDYLTPPHYHEFLAERIDDCELTIVEEAAHLAMLERPDAFNAAVSGFCERVGE